MRSARIVLVLVACDLMVGCGGSTLAPAAVAPVGRACVSDDGELGAILAAVRLHMVGVVFTVPDVAALPLAPIGVQTRLAHCDLATPLALLVLGSPHGWEVDACWLQGGPAGSRSCYPGAVIHSASGDARVVRVRVRAYFESWVLAELRPDGWHATSTMSPDD